MNNLLLFSKTLFPSIERQSRLFGKNSRTAPAGETSVNAQLLEQASFVRKYMAGVYLYLPLGWRVLQSIQAVIREELHTLGAQELFFSVLQPKELWEKTGRWSELSPVMYQFQDHSKKDIGLGVTHEEAMADTVRHHVSSYKDLPLALYQIQWKFRHEPRAKSGLNRGREFLMKDLYSFHATSEDCNLYYEKVKEAYLKIFSRLDLSARVVEASGGAFSKEPSHEFQVFSEAGEDHIFSCSSCDFAQNKEIATVKTGDACPQCSKKTITEQRGIEVGNIFRLGTRFSEPLGASFLSATGERRPIVMASYGIGVSRLMGTIVETHHDKEGMCWPDAVAPFQVHLLRFGSSPELHDQSEALLSAFEKAGITVLYDDRNQSPGASLADADLIGIPARVVISAKTNGRAELKYRTESDAHLLDSSVLISQLTERFSRYVR